MARPMKDSGIAWIGEIPEGWNVLRLKSLFSFGKGLPITKENLEETGVPVISYGQIHSKTNTGVKLQDDLFRFVSPSYIERNAESLVHSGDIIVADTSEDTDGCGNCVHVDREMQLFAGYHTIILQALEQDDNKYLAYQMKTDPWRSQIRSRVSGVKVFSISRKILSDSLVVFPPLSERSRIAAYLDHHCAEIDHIMEQTRVTIEEYKKLKQSIIAEAVTHGVRGPRMMKDSGVEWIGEIPEDWKVSPLKAYIDILPGYAFSSDDFDTEIGIPLLRGINVAPGMIRWDDVVYWNKQITTQLEPFLLRENDLVVGLDRPWISDGTRLALITNEDTPSLLLQRVCRIRPKMGIDIRFIYHTIAGKAFEETLSTETTGISVPHISTKQIQEYRIAVPELSEQEEICDSLVCKCTEIDRLIDSKQQLLTELEAYKKSVIYEYVTGKREVPQ